MGKKTEEVKKAAPGWPSQKPVSNSGAHLSRRAKKDKWAYGPKQTAGRSKNSRRSV